MEYFQAGEGKGKREVERRGRGACRKFAGAVRVVVVNIEEGRKRKRNEREACRE